MMERPLVPQAEIDELIDGVILPFYGIKRDMSVPTEEFRSENDAEHSWGLAILSCSMAARVDPELDVGLVSQFALVHDLTELEAGDTSVWADDEALASKKQREADALRVIKAKYGHFPWLVNALEAYERMDTTEAKYVRAMDKFLAMHIRRRDHGRYYIRKQIDQAIFERNLAVVRQKAHLHSGVGEYFERIYAEFLQHPEYFYQD